MKRKYLKMCLMPIWQIEKLIFKIAVKIRNNFKAAIETFPASPL